MSRAHGAWIEARREVSRLEHRRVYRLLEVQPVMDMPEEELERPLVLLVPARRAESHVGAAVSRDQRRGESRSGPLARGEARGHRLVQPEHLAPRRYAETEFGYGGRRLA